jgi:tyrosyl-tRNA synthetase
VPSASLPRGDHDIVDLLTATGLVASRSAARRALEEGGAYVNNVRLDPSAPVVSLDQALHGR